MRTTRKVTGWMLAFAMLCGMFNVQGTTVNAEESTAKSMTVQKTSTPPVIDGTTDESIWTVQEPMTVKIGEGNPDEAKFGLLWDNTYLYIAVNAADDKLVHNGTGYWFEQDNIGIFFDPSRHRSAPFVDSDMQIGIGFQPDTTTPSFNFGAAPNHANKDEKKILRAIQKTDAGWTGEIAVPWDMLNFDPVTAKELGFEIGVTDRDDAAAPGPTQMWSAYNTTSFWNDTTGYGSLILEDSGPVSGQISDVLLEDNFDGYQSGETPANWISDVNAGSSPITVSKAEDGSGSLLFDGNAAGRQARISAPVQWDNYTVEADVTFEGVLNSGRWASLMFRGASSGKQPYNQMAVRQNGAYEIAYRKPDNSWSVPVSGTWGKPLDLNQTYSWKVRVFGRNVKLYIKASDEASYTLLTDKTLSAELLERGKVGFQADQSKVRFDNLKVTRIHALSLEAAVPESLEALTGPAEVAFTAHYSDGIVESVPADQVKLYSSDESITKIVNNKLYPVKAGQAVIKAIYGNAEVQRQITVTPSTTGAQIVSLKHAEGYVLADTGKEIDPAALTFQAEFNDLTSGTVRGDALTWTSESLSVTVENGKLNVLDKGVHWVTAQGGSATVKLLVVAKAPADSEYVLYEENFDQLAEGSMPMDWKRIEGTSPALASVTAGSFILDARTSPDNPSRVLLPGYLSLFGNYTIEADMTHLAANDAARWHSIMYRVQNGNYPYYQMAVRQNASAVNGVEFAERTPANAWNVPDKGAFTESIAPDKMYHYTVKAHGNRVQQWINDKLVVDTDAASAYSKGAIGLQANGSKAKVDNVRVTLLQEQLPPMPADRFVHVAEPHTGISLAPSVIANIESKEQWNRLTDDKAASLPATVILHLNKDLFVTEGKGRKTIGSLDEVLQSMNNRMIPAFYVEDQVTVTQLAEYLKSAGLEDAFVISDKADLVRMTREAYPIVRGIVDFGLKGKIDRLTAEQLMEIRRTTNRGLAKIALLPQKAATAEQTVYLQERLITVWAMEEEKKEDEQQLALHRLITSGVNGIVTDAPEKAVSALGVYNHGTTLIRKPLIIGHRGIPSLAPENTMEGFKLAYEKGADMIENDIFISKDGHLVIMHDSTLNRTTTGTGNVEDYTLEQLKTFKANKQFPETYPDAGIPTLAEVFDEFKDKDVLHFVEIKSYKPETVDALVKLIKEKDVEDQVAVISFSDQQLKRLGEQMPEMSMGFLTGGYANEASVNKSLRETLKVIQSLNTTFNTSYPGVGPKFMEAAKHRGITLWPWTFRDLNETMNYYARGTHGLTTDYAQWASDWPAELKPEMPEYKLKANKALELSAIVKTHIGTESKVTPEIVVIDGNEKVKVEGNKVTGLKKGKVYVLLRYTASLDAARQYDLYTVPVIITVQ
ncbi:glycerophosphodiester phosphodiesterase family protein [Paenibacillus arenilitoris]|uniref:DUF1080 domain-containing protein n=1 Tax=Paenibacillus arenilitoris TaxID=2772299 RepID=A0A927H8B3_9BACL|nr:glycerophosphodiester phosphodiesterase family protein [Paenibacillus arenilitoris]MBD2871895.1 DUF1080 domain-containing protein [Paenibacillus arenilitoris]